MCDKEKVTPLDCGQAMQEKVPIDTNGLVRLAIFLEGYKLGKGNIHPLGTIELVNLWNAISYLQGDVCYSNKKIDDKLYNYVGALSDIIALVHKSFPEADEFIKKVDKVLIDNRIK